MLSANIHHSVSRGMAWLASNPTPLGDIIQLADEAWFFKMMLLRHGAQDADDAATWAKALDQRLDIALGTDVQTRLRAPHVGEPLGWCDQSMGALMLAHLLWLCRPDSAATRAYISTVHQHFMDNAQELYEISPLYNFCFDYNFSEMGLQAPEHCEAIPVIDGLWGTNGLIDECYYHTHVILFATGTFRREPVDLDSMDLSLLFIKEHTHLIIRYQWVDLCAEFALCLSICDHRDAEFSALIGAILRSQPETGRWTHPWCNDRQSRHCTMMAILALLEAQKKGAPGPECEDDN